jgi:hypothetical protein
VEWPLLKATRLTLKCSWKKSMHHLCLICIVLHIKLTWWFKLCLSYHWCWKFSHCSTWCTMTMHKALMFKEWNQLVEFMGENILEFIWSKVFRTTNFEVVWIVRPFHLEMWFWFNYLIAPWGGHFILFQMVWKKQGVYICIIYNLLKCKWGDYNWLGKYI